MQLRIFHSLIQSITDNQKRISNPTTLEEDKKWLKKEVQLYESYIQDHKKIILSSQAERNKAVAALEKLGESTWLHGSYLYIHKFRCVVSELITSVLSIC